MVGDHEQARGDRQATQKRRQFRPDRAAKPARWSLPDRGVLYAHESPCYGLGRTINTDRKEPAQRLEIPSACRK